MTTDQIVEKLRQGYVMEYASVTGGQCLYDGDRHVINLEFLEFDTARQDPRVRMLGTQRQGHPIFHGRVDHYSLAEE